MGDVVPQTVYRPVGPRWETPVPQTLCGFARTSQTTYHRLCREANTHVLVVENYIRRPDALDWNPHVIESTELCRIPAK